MKEYTSTDIFLEQLANGTYPRVVLENDEEELDFESVTDRFRKLTSRPGHYDYLLRLEKRGEQSETKT